MTATERRAGAVVLGAGVSGLVGASILLEQGCKSVVLLDEYDHVGGNHIDVAIGDYTFDVGSLIFQDDSPLLDHFPMLLDHYVPIEPQWSRINPYGVVTEYPFSMRDDLLDAGAIGIARIIVSAATGRLTPRRRMRTAEDFARRAVGKRFLESSGLRHYMEKLCGSPIEEIELTFAQSRMAWVADQTRPREVASRVWRAASGRQRPPEENRQLARPRAGFSSLYAHAVADLEARGAEVRLSAGLRSLRREGDGWVVELSDGDLRADRVYSTIPVARAMQLVGLTPPPLPTVTLLSLFYSFRGSRGFHDPILYNFTDEPGWKRLTVYSDFYGAVADREYFTVEVVGQRAAAPRDADAAFRRHVSGLGLFAGDLTLEGHHVLENAYPVFTRGSGDRAAGARARLAREGIESFGRQGGFDYQPTARASTIAAEEALGAERERS